MDTADHRAPVGPLRRWALDRVSPYTQSLEPWLASECLRCHGHGFETNVLLSTGWQLWRIFLELDSNVHPMKTYGDFAFRLFGSTARHVINILQSVQLLFNVGVSLFLA